ncbi:unnamed protein product [Closterium sp. Naga37s-1]|nr:unnamed protein product [Closterium sp. Naga37s-1]
MGGEGIDRGRAREAVAAATGAADAASGVAAAAAATAGDEDGGSEAETSENSNGSWIRLIQHNHPQPQQQQQQQQQQHENKPLPSSLNGHAEGASAFASSKQAQQAQHEQQAQQLQGPPGDMAGRAEGKDRRHVDERVSVQACGGAADTAEAAEAAEAGGGCREEGRGQERREEGRDGREDEGNEGGEGSRLREREQEGALEGGQRRGEGGAGVSGVAEGSGLSRARSCSPMGRGGVVAREMGGTGEMDERKSPARAREVDEWVASCLQAALDPLSSAAHPAGTAEGVVAAAAAAAAARDGSRAGARAALHLPGVRAAGSDMDRDGDGDGDGDGCCDGGSSNGDEDFNDPDEFFSVAGPCSFSSLFPPPLSPFLPCSLHPLRPPPIAPFPPYSLSPLLPLPLAPPPACSTQSLSRSNSMRSFSRSPRSFPIQRPLAEKTTAAAAAAAAAANPAVAARQSDTVRSTNTADSRASDTIPAAGTAGSSDSVAATDTSTVVSNAIGMTSAVDTASHIDPRGTAAVVNATNMTNITDTANATDRINVTDDSVGGEAVGDAAAVASSAQQPSHEPQTPLDRPPPVPHSPLPSPSPVPHSPLPFPSPAAHSPLPRPTTPRSLPYRTRSTDFGSAKQRVSNLHLLSSSLLSPSPADAAAPSPAASLGGSSASGGAMSGYGASGGGRSGGEGRGGRPGTLKKWKSLQSHSGTIASLLQGHPSLLPLLLRFSCSAFTPFLCSISTAILFLHVHITLPPAAPPLRPTTPVGTDPWLARTPKLSPHYPSMAGTDAEAPSTVDRGRSSGSMRLPPLDAPAAAGAAAGSGGMGMDRPGAAGAGGGGSLLERTSGASGSGGALLSRLFRTSSALNPSESVKRLLMWPRAGSQLFRCSPSARAATNCWSPADPSLLLVQGPSYASDGAKVAPAAPTLYEPWAADVFHTSPVLPPRTPPVYPCSDGAKVAPAAPPLYEPWAADVFHTSRKIRHIAAHVDLPAALVPPPGSEPAAQSSNGLPPVLIVNIQRMLPEPVVPFSFLLASRPSVQPLCPLLCHPPLSPPLPPPSASPAHPPAAPAATAAAAVAAAAGVGWAGPECGAVLPPGGALAQPGKRSCTDGGTWTCGYGGVRLWGSCVRRAGLGLSVVLYCRVGAHWRSQAEAPVHMRVSVVGVGSMGAWTHVGRAGPECGAVLPPGCALALPGKRSRTDGASVPTPLLLTISHLLLPVRSPLCCCPSVTPRAAARPFTPVLPAYLQPLLHTWGPRHAQRAQGGAAVEGKGEEGGNRAEKGSPHVPRAATEEPVKRTEQPHGAAGRAAEGGEAAGEGAAGREAERSVPHVEGNSSSSKTRRSNSGRRRGSWSSYSSADDTTVGGEVAVQGHRGKEHGGKEHVRREHGGKSERWSRSGGEDGEREGGVEKVVWDRPKLMVRLVNEGEVALSAAAKKLVEGCSGKAVLTRPYHTVLQSSAQSNMQPDIDAHAFLPLLITCFLTIPLPTPPSLPPCSPPSLPSSAQPYMELDIDAHAFPPAHQRALLSLRPHLPDAILDLALVLQASLLFSPFVEAQAQQVGERVGGAKAPRGENVAGDFYVDHTCINCDVCRWMAPEVFAKVGSQSAVFAQPGDEATALKALQALLSCPTASIHSRDSLSLVPRARDAFPLPIDASALPGVFHCGYHSRKSFGAASYFIQRAAGNVMVDCPRYSEHLAETLARMGGVRYIVLTHRDDVADHARWAARFKAERVLHALEVQPDTTDVEMLLDGTGPWCLGSDLKIIFTPGHTEGSVSVLYKAHGGALFSGDHLAYAPNTESLTIFRRVNWYSVPVQVQSAKKLVGLPFRWVLPGHGRRFHFASEEQRDEMLQQVVAGEEALLLRGQ